MVDISARLDSRQAHKLLLEILASGRLFYSRHAEEEMAHDDITKGDVLNVLRGGQITEPAEHVHGSWRYRVHTRALCVVAAFAAEDAAVVVTAWRKKR